MKTLLSALKLSAICLLFALPSPTSQAGCTRTTGNDLTGKCEYSLLNHDYNCVSSSPKDCKGGCNCGGPIM